MWKSAEGAVLRCLGAALLVRNGVRVAESLHARLIGA